MNLIETLEKISGKKVLLEDINKDLYDCWTTGYHDEISKYGNEYNVSLEEAVDFAIYFDTVSEKYSEEEVFKILSSLEKEKTHMFTPYGDLIGVYIKKK